MREDPELDNKGLFGKMGCPYLTIIIIIKEVKSLVMKIKHYQFVHDDTELNTPTLAPVFFKSPPPWKIPSQRV